MAGRTPPGVPYFGVLGAAGGLALRVVRRIRVAAVLANARHGARDAHLFFHEGAGRDTEDDSKEKDGTHAFSCHWSHGDAREKARSACVGAAGGANPTSRMRARRWVSYFVVAGAVHRAVRGASATLTATAALVGYRATN
jgi:hypothetical protein